MRNERPEIRLKDIYSLLPNHELVSLRVKTNTGYYDEIPHLVYEGLPYDRTIAIVEKIEARGTECIEITIKENRVIAKEYRIVGEEEESTITNIEHMPFNIPEGEYS